MIRILLGAGLGVVYAVVAWIVVIGTLGVTAEVIAGKGLLGFVVLGALVVSGYTLVLGGPAALLSSWILTRVIDRSGSRRARYLKTFALGVPLAIASAAILGVLLEIVRAPDALAGWLTVCLPACLAGALGMARGIVLEDREDAW